MAKSVKGTPEVRQSIVDAASNLESVFWAHWKQVDISTAKHLHGLFVGMLPKLFEISHTRGKQGHGKTHAA